MPTSRNPESIFGPYTRRAAGAARTAWVTSAAYVVVAVVAIMVLLGCSSGVDSGGTGAAPADGAAPARN